MASGFFGGGGGGNIWGDIGGVLGGLAGLALAPETGGASLALDVGLGSFAGEALGQKFSGEKFNLGTDLTGAALAGGGAFVGSELGLIQGGGGLDSLFGGGAAPAAAPGAATDPFSVMTNNAPTNPVGLGTGPAVPTDVGTAGAGGGGGSFWDKLQQGAISSLTRDPLGLLFKGVGTAGNILDQRGAGQLGAISREQLTNQTNIDANRLAYMQQLSQLQANPSQVFNDPGYKSLEQANQQAVQRNLAAAGYSGSGNMVLALANADQQFANQYLQQREGQLATLSGLGSAPSGVDAKNALLAAKYGDEGDNMWNQLGQLFGSSTARPGTGTNIAAFA